MPPKKDIQPKAKKEARPTKFQTPRREIEHKVIRGRRKEALLNLYDIRREITRTRTSIEDIEKRGPAIIARNRQSTMLGNLRSRLRTLLQEYNRQEDEAWNWEDLYQQGGGDMNFPPPPPPPPPAGGGAGIAV